MTDLFFMPVDLSFHPVIRSCYTSLKVWLQAAVELDGQFNSAIVPQAYVHGTQCEIGFDVRHTAQPMQANFHSYYMVKKCKFLLFDCHWGPEVHRPSLKNLSSLSAFIPSVCSVFTFLPCVVLLSFCVLTRRQNDHTWWSWSGPAIDEILYQKQWHIGV